MYRFLLVLRKSAINLIMAFSPSYACPNRTTAGISFGELQCSGQGTCVVSPISNLSLCLCDLNFNGASDFFDLRVEWIAGKYVLALDCPNNVIGTQIVWAISLTVFAFVWVRALAVYLKNFGLSNIPQRCVAVEVCFDLPVLIIIASFKVAYPNDVVFGTSAWETILFMITEILHTCVHFMLGILEFRVFGLFQSPQFRKMFFSYKLRIWTSVVLFFFTAIISPLIMLRLNKSIGPVLNLQFVLILVRNFGTVILVLTGFLVADQNLKQFKAAQSSSERSEQKSVERLERFNQVLRFLKKQRLESMYGLILLFIIYLICSLPWIWPYQTYFIAIMACIGHAGFNASSLLQAKSKQNARKKDTVVSSKVDDIANGSIATAQHPQQHEQRVSKTISSNPDENQNKNDSANQMMSNIN